MYTYLGRYTTCYDIAPGRYGRSRDLYKGIVGSDKCTGD
jgi:hypothetical protein